MTAIEGAASIDPIEELDHENKLSEQLLEHISDLARALTTDALIVPGEIAEGLRLLEQYRNVHRDRLDNDLAPEVRRTSSRAGFQHFASLGGQRRSESAVIERARVALEEFANNPGPLGHTQPLAASLNGVTNTVGADIEFERHYPLCSLADGFPPDSLARISEAFLRTRPDLEDLEHHITRYLARPARAPSEALTVRCGQADCGAVARSHTVPASRGQFGMELPIGWQAVTSPPVFDKEGVVRVNVDFRCPKHHEPEPPGTSEEPETCSCCDPIPEE